MLFWKQRERKNGRINISMKSSRKDVPEARIDRGAPLFPSDIVTDQALAPGNFSSVPLAKTVHNKLLTLPLIEPRSEKTGFLGF